MFPEGSLNARYSREEITERVTYADQLALAMLKGDIKTLPQATYRWVLDQPGVSIALSGAKNLDELQDPLSGSSNSPFDIGTQQAIESMHLKDFGAA